MSNAGALIEAAPPKLMDEGAMESIGSGGATAMLRRAEFKYY